MLKHDGTKTTYSLLLAEYGTANFNGYLFHCVLRGSQMTVSYGDFIERDRPKPGDEILHRGERYRVSRVTLLTYAIVLDMDKQ